MGETLALAGGQASNLAVGGNLRIHRGQTIGLLAATVDGQTEETGLSPGTAISPTRPGMDAPEFNALPNLYAKYRHPPGQRNGYDVADRHDHVRTGRLVRDWMQRARTRGLSRGDDLALYCVLSLQLPADFDSRGPVAEALQDARARGIGLGEAIDEVPVERWRNGTKCWSGRVTSDADMGAGSYDARFPGDGLVMRNAVCGRLHA